MKMKTKIIITIGILALALGGCRMNHKYTNQEEAKSYLLARMDKKYDETFMIVGNEIYKNYGLIYGDCYSCDLALKDEPDKVGSARITQDGNLIDDWAVNYFKDEAEKEVNEALSGDSNDNMTIKSVSLQAPATSDTWRAEDGIDKYLKESGAYMKIVATSNRGLSNDEYAELIYEFLKPMYSIKMNMEVAVKVGRTYIFFKTINTLGENKTPEYTLEQIKQEVIEEWDSSPFETH